MIENTANYLYDVSSVFLKNRHLARVTEDETLFYGTDHQGSTVLVTDETGTMVWTGEATPFGDGIVREEGDRTDIALKYTGKDLDEDTGLYYYNARWYDAGTGRFISEDPARDGQNWYAYVSNNPLTFTDPTGLYTDEKSKDSGDDYEHSQSAAGKKEIERGEREHKKKKEIEDTAKELKDLEENAETFKDRVKIAFKRTQLKNRIRALAASGSDTARDWIKANTEINVIRGRYETVGGDRYWDGRMSLDFMDVSLESIRVQTWADHPQLDPGDGTLRTGSYVAELKLDQTFKDRIYLMDSGFQFHANQLASSLIPYGDKPFSQGCIIGQASDYFGLTDTMRSMGYQFNDLDTINVNIGLSRNNIPTNSFDYNNHYDPALISRSGS